MRAEAIIVTEERIGGVSVDVLRRMFQSGLLKQTNKNKRTSIKSYDKSCVDTNKGDTASVFLPVDRESLHVGIQAIGTYERETICLQPIS